MRSVIENLLSRHPAFGYVFASLTSGTGLLAIMETATKIGAFLTVVLGLLVGYKTYKVQHLQEKKLKKELSGLD